MYMKKALSFCFLFAVLTAMGEAITLVSQPFASETKDLTQITGEKSGTWSGYGEVKAATGTYGENAGLPISAALGNVLSVDGNVTCKIGEGGTSAAKPISLDMMVQIVKPVEALALPSDEGGQPVQIAVGVDTDGSLKVYCTDKKADATGWYVLKESGLEEGSWHRVSFTFDYGRGTCQVGLDGVACVTEHGFIASDSAMQPDSPGAWYKFAKTGTGDAKNKLNVVKVIGSTSIDEVLVKSGETYAEVLPQPKGEVDGVPQAWLLAQGVVNVTDKAPDQSGLTVAEKYQAGLGVLDGETYAIKAMAMSGGADAVKVTLTVPKMTPPSGYKNVIKYGSASDALDASQDIGSGAEAVELSVAKAKTGVTKIYYKMVSEKMESGSVTEEVAAR